MTMPILEEQKHLFTVLKLVTFSDLTDAKLRVPSFNFPRGFVFSLQQFEPYSFTLTETFSRLPRCVVLQTLKIN